MLLSEAIRAGIKIKPVQIHGTYFGIDKCDNQASCALGAAYDSIPSLVKFGGGKLVIAEVLIKQFPILHKSLSPVDSDDCHDRLVTREHCLFDHIVWLNDVKFATREHIASYVECIEMEEAAKLAPEEEVCV